MFWECCVLLTGEELTFRLVDTQLDQQVVVSAHNNSVTMTTTAPSEDFPGRLPQQLISK